MRRLSTSGIVERAPSCTDAKVDSADVKLSTHLSISSMELMQAITSSTMHMHNEQ